MPMKRTLTTFLLLAVTVSALPLPVGSWRLFSSYSDIKEIEPAGKEVYVLASSALYSYNTADGSLTTYDRTTCLNSTDITHIKWVPATRVLVIAYSDATFDIMAAENDVTFNTDIKDKQMNGDKTINYIYADGRLAYICTGFGIVVYDTRNGYITDTYALGCSVSYCYRQDNCIYAASPEAGLLRGRLTDNLLNKNEWESAGAFQPLAAETYKPDTRNSCYWGPDADGKLAKFVKEDGEMKQASTGVAPDGPFTNYFWRLYMHDGKLFATSGRFSTNFVPGRKGIVQYLENSEWTLLEAPGTDILGDEYIDPNCMAFDPKDKNHFWVGGYNGLIEYRNYHVVNFWNSLNSIAPPIYNVDKKHSLVCSMTYDSDNTLWPMFGWCDTPIHSLDQQNGLRAFPHEENSFENFYCVDQQGVFISPTNGFMWWTNYHVFKPALLKYDYKNDILLSFKQFNDQDGNVLNFNYACTASEDKKGNVWLLTDKGPFYLTYEQAKQQDAAGLTVTRHKVPRNDGTNYADYLLDGINVRCMATDALNRKWFGTEGIGVFLISSDNNTQISHFTTENSPLPSDVIFDILIDDATGIVYFATDKGLCAYQSDVSGNISADGEMSSGNVWAYPNPVTPEHTGDIVIVGLAENTDVKIVTSSGRLVHSGRCAGGSYRWNGCDTKGKPVASGMYMVLVAKSDGSKGVVTKIGIVR